MTDTTYDINKHSLSPSDILSPDYLGRKPTILVNISDDDTTRGDTAGRKGLAQVIAKKVNADVLYADVKTLNNLYPTPPNTMKTSYDDKLAKFLSEHRSPDMVLGFSCFLSLRKNGKDTQQVNYITEINECLSSEIIVSHHLTDEMLKEEGLKFDTAYPDLKQPIIAVLLVDPHPTEQKEFIKNLSKITSKYKEATIFLCASRRTKSENYDKLLSGLKKSINGSKLFSKNKGVTVTGFKFDREAEFNPYRGLIARSEHFILWGDSMSMMSEPLITGKTVHMYGVFSSNIDYDLEKKGVVADFNNCAKKNQFLTTNFTPINVTETVADKLTVDFKTSITKKIEEQEEKCKIYPTAWQNHLIKIYFDYNHIKETPPKLRQDNAFIMATLGQNGMAIKHLSDAEKSKNIFIRLATINNRETFKFSNDRTKDHDETMFHIVEEHPVLYKDCSDRLKSSHSFNLRLLEYGVSIATDIMDKKLFEHSDIALAAIKICDCDFGYASETLTDDPNFIQNALKENIDCFQYLPKKYRGQTKIIRHIIDQKPELVRHATDDVLDNEMLVSEALEKEGSIIRHVSKNLRKDSALTCLALRNGAVPADIDDSFHGNKPIMLIACRNNWYGYYSCNKTLKEDPDICIATLQNEFSLWRDFPEKMKNNTDVCIGLLKINMGKGWDKIATDKKNNADFLIECAKLKNFPVENIPVTFYQDLKFTKQLIEIRPEWRKFSNIASALEGKNKSASKTFNNLKSYSKAIAMIKSIKSILPSASSLKK